MQEYKQESYETRFRDIHDYIRVVIRRRWTILITFFAVFLGVAVHTLSIVPIYEAFTTLRIRGENARGGMFVLSAGGSNPIDTEIEILRSRTFAENVAKKLHMEWQVSKKSKGHFRLIEFNPSIQRSSYHIVLTAPDAFLVQDSEGNILGSGKGGVLTRDNGLNLLISDLEGKAGDSFKLSRIPFAVAAAKVKNSINAAEAGKGTNIIRLSFRDADPVLARDAVNTLSQIYLEQSVAIKTQEASKSMEFIEQQLNFAQGDLDKAEKNLQAYKNASGTLSLDAEAQSLIQKMSETEKLKMDIALQRKQLEFALSALSDAMKQGKVYSPSVMKYDMVSLSGKLADLEVQKRALLADYTEAEPQVRAIDEQIDEVQRKILAAYKTTLKDLTQQETITSQQIARYEGELKRLPKAMRELGSLTRYAKVNAEIYTLLLQKYQEIRIAKASTISDVDVIDPAITPQVPVKPNKQKNLLVGFLVGAMMSVGLAFFREYLDNTIKDAEEARRELDLPLLAGIPFIPSFIPSRERETDKERGFPFVAYREPKSSVSEAFRSLRTSIHFSAINKKRQILMVTSSFPMEGKTTIIGNLAVILCQTGTRALLIDCDLRHPSLHRLFGYPKTPGITELLAGDTAMDSLVHDTGIPGLDFITAGTTPPNPAELLSSDAMRKLLQSFRERYDNILLDAPPVLAVTDAPLLATMSDMVLVVLELGRVPVKAAQHMGEMLEKVGAPVAGIVVNDKSKRSLQQYGYYGDSYYGYSYGYSHYGDDSGNKGRKRKRWWRRFFK